MALSQVRKDVPEGMMAELQWKDQRWPRENGVGESFQAEESAIHNSCGKKGVGLGRLKMSENLESVYVWGKRTCSPGSQGHAPDSCFSVLGLLFMVREGEAWSKDGKLDKGIIEQFCVPGRFLDCHIGNRLQWRSRET